MWIMEVTKVRYWTRQDYNALLKKRVHSLRLAKKEYFTKDDFWRKYERIRGSISSWSKAQSIFDRYPVDVDRVIKEDTMYFVM